MYNIYIHLLFLEDKGPVILTCIHNYGGTEKSRLFIHVYGKIIYPQKI